ncbi:NAD(P)/FAD-dependent oxidoreductase [Amycolatopsis cihanbeyliensis]|uniref:Putative NAD(P)-binding protein n=1 Tax=Amycolatopsis cihanbeyliensis TaxID=1128664 RepID=A0A542DLZ6_AMYCI|nr:NAD(P)/FAD-dependent oxidoreductase [Amycolatopsis cihanbeyliensis]TQJ04004.1 putative NAD(P)-binding protein [Amycolatopsis cihanbeyliensis]
MKGEITIVGGGLAGLVAAITCAEAGAAVTLHEAHASLGGRGRATPPPHVAHEGAHVFYADGPHWTWMKERDLVGKLGWPPLPAALRVGFRDRGRFRRGVPAGLLRLAAGRKRAPVDQDFRTWATARYGERTAEAAANAISVVTFAADTGRLSAAFVQDLLLRVLNPIVAVRWVVGGWQAVLDRMAERARELGVRIELKSRLTELPAGPTIVATELSSARVLLGDDSLRWESGDCVMLDLAVTRDRRDAFVVFDLDEGGFHECYSAQDPTIAPAGESLFQIDMPVRAGERTADTHRRLESFTDLLVPGWRDRTTWQRTGRARGRTGALDLPGFTWRDRPAIERGDDVFLAGDMVAAPGMRGEISMNSALRAAEGAVRALNRSVPAA